MKSALIIRPDGKCQKTVNMFVERGLNAHGAPLIDIAKRLAVCREVTSNLISSNPPDVVIFTSTYAAKFVIEAMREHDWPDNVNIITIGTSTAAMFTPIHIATQKPEVSTSEGLLNMDSLIDVKDKRLAIIKGMGGRKLLEQHLTQRGAHVSSFDCYERLLNIAAVEQLSQNKESADYVVATSGELIELALTYLGDSWRFKPWVVVSERTAQLARERGIKNIVISPSAHDKDLYMTCKKMMNSGVLHDRQA